MGYIKELHKRHFTDYYKIYKVFIISSLVYFILSFALFSRTQDLPFDMILAMVYGAYSAPLLGIIVFHQSIYQHENVEDLKKTDLLLVFLYPVLIPITIFVIYAIIRVPSGLSLITEPDRLGIILVYALLGFSIYVPVSYLYLGIRKFELSIRQFIWKIAMIVVYIVLFYVLPGIFNIEIYESRSHIYIGIGIILSIHLIAEMLFSYYKTYDY